MDLPFFIRFIISSIIISILTLLIHITKRTFKKHLTVITQYYIWFIFFIMLITPFISFNTLHSNVFTNLNQTVSIDSVTNTSNSSIQSTNWFKDFYIYQDSDLFDSINLLLSTIWIVGTVIVLILTIHNIKNLNTIKRSLLCISDSKINSLFTNCKSKLNINRNVKLTESYLVNTPIIIGVIQPIIVLPKDFIFTSSDNDIKYIFLHELYHYKHKDILVNYLLCAFQIIY